MLHRGNTKDPCLIEASPLPMSHGLALFLSLREARTQKLLLLSFARFRHPLQERDSFLRSMPAPIISVIPRLHPDRRSSAELGEEFHEESELNLFDAHSGFRVLSHLFLCGTGTCFKSPFISCLQLRRSGFSTACHLPCFCRGQEENRQFSSPSPRKLSIAVDPLLV